MWTASDADGASPVAVVPDGKGDWKVARYDIDLLDVSASGDVSSWGLPRGSYLLSVLGSETDDEEVVLLMPGGAGWSFDDASEAVEYMLKDMGRRHKKPAAKKAPAKRKPAAKKAPAKKPAAKKTTRAEWAAGALGRELGRAAVAGLRKTGAVRLTMDPPLVTAVARASVEEGDLQDPPRFYIVHHQDDDISGSWTEELAKEAGFVGFPKAENVYLLVSEDFGWWNEWATA